MKKIALILLSFVNITCFSVINYSEPRCKYSKTETTEGLINQVYMNCYTYFGENSMQHGVVNYPNSNTPIYGISKVRGKYEIKIENKKSSECIKGDCINGDGIEQFYLSEKDIFLWEKEDKMVSYTNNFGTFTYKGTFKNFLKFNGMLADEKGKILAKYDNGKETPTPYFYEKIKTIREDTLKKERKDIVTYYEKLDTLSEQREMEYAKSEREELTKFINKMYNIGARDFNSCFRLCHRFNMSYNCGSKCQEAMNINYSSSTPRFSTSPPFDYGNLIYYVQ